MVGRTAPPPTEPGERPTGRVRSVVYGPILAMSVLAHLGDPQPRPRLTAVTVSGTHLVILLAVACAEVVARTLASFVVGSAIVLPKAALH